MLSVYLPPLGAMQLSLVVGSSVDDNYVGFTLPFPFYLQGVNYQSNYIGSNSYITFGFASTAYLSLSATNPGRGLLVQAADNSYQRVYIGQETATSYRIRYEGTNSLSGTVGSPSMVVEYTFYANNNIMVNCGVMARSGGQNGLSSGSGYLVSPPFAQSTNYILTSSNGGSTWSYYSAAFFDVA